MSAGGISASCYSLGGTDCVCAACLVLIERVSSVSGMDGTDLISCGCEELFHMEIQSYQGQNTRNSHEETVESSSMQDDICGYHL